MEDFENNHEQMRKLGTNVSFGDTIQVTTTHDDVSVCVRLTFNTCMCNMNYHMTLLAFTICITLLQQELLQAETANTIMPLQSEVLLSCVNNET